MANQVLLEEVVFQGATGLPTDRYVNSFVFRTDDGPIDSNDHDTLTAMIMADFYNHAVGGDSIAASMSSQIDRTLGGVTVRGYDITAHLDGTPHGSPTHVSQGSLSAAAGGDPMPEEVAAVLSFHGDLTGVPEKAGAIRPAARRRGRLYLGPLEYRAVGTAGAGVFLALNFQGRILDAASNFLNLHGVGDMFTWVVWSRTEGATHDVVGGWLDNAFDTQERRGVKANGRTVWS